MIIEPSGVIFTGICEVQTERCVARQPAPVSAIWTSPQRLQVDVCGACLPEMVRNGEWEIPGARVSPRHDVVVMDTRGRSRLLIDVNTGAPGTATDAEEWACRIHHNLVRYLGLPVHATFMLVGFPDRFYIWAPPAARDKDSAPSFQLQSADVLAPYLLAMEDQGPAARERAVAEWVQSFLAYTPPGDAGPAGWLAAAGLLDEVRDGSIARQMVAA
jgi:hypothetical protein